ncbi:MAG: hypothetical protein M3516_00170 [Actinomycetota bacterium]|nr:hypothetical protein [Actinomycetota bacterium]MDQ5814698.1 hypothetical protein [Actinomycetota bacterium]
MGGWWVGLGIGTAVVLIVVVVVTTILFYANRIGKQAKMASEALDLARDTTKPLWAVQQINYSAKQILEAMRAARGALGG